MYFQYKNEKAIVVVGTYDNGRMGLRLESTIGEPIGSLTVNVPEEKLEDGEFFVKTWSENVDLVAAARASHIFIDTGKRIIVGHNCVAEVWRFKPGLESWLEDDRFVNFILDDEKNLIPVSMLEASYWRAEHPEEYIVAKDTVNGIEISTIFIGLDLSSGRGKKSKCFETKVDGGKYKNWCTRHESWDEAKCFHIGAVEALKRGENLTDD